MQSSNNIGSLNRWHLLLPLCIQSVPKRIFADHSRCVLPVFIHYSSSLIWMTLDADICKISVVVLFTQNPQHGIKFLNILMSNVFYFGYQNVSNQGPYTKAIKVYLKMFMSYTMKETEDDPYSQLAVSLLRFSLFVLAMPPLPAANTHTLHYPEWHCVTSSAQEKNNVSLLSPSCIWVFVRACMCATLGVRTCTWGTFTAPLDGSNTL